MDPEIKSKFRDMNELIITGYAEGKQLRLAKYRIGTDHLYQSVEEYMNLKRSINNIIFEINSIFTKIIQLSFKEDWSGRMYIKILLWYYKLRVKPLIWSQEMNT